MLYSLGSAVNIALKLYLVINIYCAVHIYYTCSSIPNIDLRESFFTQQCWVTLQRSQENKCLDLLTQNLEVFHTSSSNCPLHATECSNNLWAFRVQNFGCCWTSMLGALGSATLHWCIIVLKLFYVIRTGILTSKNWKIHPQEGFRYCLN